VSGPEVQVCLVTAPDEEVATRLARGAVEAGLAACCNLIPGVRSVYRWEGALCDDAELLLIFKAPAAQVEALQRFVLETHPYDTPEFLAVEVSSGSPSYLAWVLGAGGSGLGP